MRSPLVFFFALMAAAASLAQDTADLRPTERSTPIQDNSFLIEEAYNLEDGVIQHISTYERLTNSHDWVYTQTDEWPVRSYKHQLSVTLAATHSGSFEGSGAGWGDTAFNYRYQLAGSGETRIAVAPRVSLLFPTGDHSYGRGSGGLGLQTNLPVSIQHSAKLVSHWNAGATWIRVLWTHAGTRLAQSASILGSHSSGWPVRASISWLRLYGLPVKALWVHARRYDPRTFT